MFFDPLYIIMMLPAMLLAIWAETRVKSAYHKYSRIGNSAGMTGADAAARMLGAMGMNIVSTAGSAPKFKNAVAIEMGSGMLSDHYDPRTHTLRLSPDVYRGRSLAAVGIACHEAGHALQHAGNYAPLSLRTAIVPTAQFGSWLGLPLILLGFLLKSALLIKFGVLLFLAIVVFQLITLPVEFNASRRAKQALADMGIVVGRQEQAGVAAVLDAAAWTYVAAAVSAVLTLLYYLMLIFGGSRE